jgi:hypothetical protein
MLQAIFIYFMYFMGNFKYKNLKLGGGQAYDRSSD